MERETGIEPATNSLEGCDSTTELLPPAFDLEAEKLPRGLPCVASATLALGISSLMFRIWWTGEDSNLRRPQGPADLQSAAFDRSATCPELRQEGGRHARPPCRCRRFGALTKATTRLSTGMVSVRF